MTNKPVYKLIDGKGRVLIPKELRVVAGMDYGDIVSLGISNGKVSVRKVDIIEVGQAEPACKTRTKICKFRYVVARDAGVAVTENRHSAGANCQRGHRAARPSRPCRTIPVSV